MSSLERWAMLAILTISGSGFAAEKATLPDVPMTRPGEMLAEHRTRYGHNSTFVALDGRRILHVAGTRATTSADGGITWSGPRDLRDTQGKPVGGTETALVKLAGLGVGLAARLYDPKAPTYAEMLSSNRMVFWRSEDEGATWQPPVALSPPGLSTASYQDNFLRTSSGRLVLPVFHFFGQLSGPKDEALPMVGKLLRGQWVSTAAHFYDPSASAVYVCYSDDDGRTWKRNADGELMILLDWEQGFYTVSESSVAEVAPGTLLMVMRNGLGRLFQAWSKDNGTTWTRPQPMPLAACESPAQIRRLPSGHLLLVWNQENEEDIMRGNVRVRISSAVSRNGGTVWEFFQNVESLLPGVRVEPGPIHPVKPVEASYEEPGSPAIARDPRYIDAVEAFGRWSYPSVLVMPDRVLVAHTYSTYEDDPVKAQQVLKREDFNQKLKVLPLKWFYGGKEPAANPWLREAHLPARP
jgi:hypothetical protein